jgi:molybdate transport system substrate-binding protein
MRPTRFWAALSLALLAALPASAETVHVFAAASLTESFKEIAGIYEKAHPGDKVELNFAGSQVLRTQIEQGAPADVFASADFAQIVPLKKQGLVATPRVFAHNRLVVVTPSSRNKVKRLGDAARPGVKVVVAGTTVPVGRYTTQAITKMNSSGLFGDDFQTRLRANVVSQETNVRAVLSKIALGEADAGFVYITDAIRVSGKVKRIGIPNRMNVIATYPISTVTRSDAKREASEFVQMVLSSQGQAILQKHGFQK